jgi:hypothetical protein
LNNFDKNGQTTTLFRMNPTLPAFALALILLTGCATTKSGGDQASRPETVLVNYRAKRGSEAALEQALSQAWQIYRREHLVFAQPHIIVRDREAGGKTRFIEIFTWVSHTAPEHAPVSVKVMWNRLTLLCESRDGHRGLEGGEVEIVPPAK